MSISSGQQAPLFLGIDGGGSKCRVVLVTADNRLLGEGLGGPANPLRGMSVATESILTATTPGFTGRRFDLPDAISQLIVGAGLAGGQYATLFPAVFQLATSVCRISFNQ